MRPTPRRDVPGQISTWIAAAIAVGISILAAVGLNDDALARVVRVYPWAVVAGAVLLISAMVMGLVGAVLGAKALKFSIVGVGCLVTALAVLVSAHAIANSAQERPTATVGIEASDAALMAQVDVSAGNLRPDQYVFVIVQGVNQDRRLKDVVAGFDEENTAPIPDQEYSKQRLYKGRIGPAPDGSVKAAIPIRLSPALYHQVVVQARILESTEASIEIEREMESQHTSTGETLPFPCRAMSSDLGCGTVTVPLTK